MSVIPQDAPQWLISSWVRACTEAGATASPEQVKDVGAALLERWTDPQRRFHDLRHLTDVLNRVDELAEETHDPALVRLAAWYHGAIFDSASAAAYANRGGENETASAVLAHDELTALGVPERVAHRVAQLVTALLRHSPDASDFDCAVLCDADLGMLAADPQRYKAYLADVRAEYSHIPLRDYVRARSAIVSKLLDRAALFSSPLGAAWEDAARQNLTAELMRLRKEQARLEAEDAIAAAAEPTAEPTTERAADARPALAPTAPGSGTAAPAPGAPAPAAPSPGASPARSTPEAQAQLRRHASPASPVTPDDAKADARGTTGVADALQGAERGVPALGGGWSDADVDEDDL